MKEELVPVQVRLKPETRRLLAVLAAERGKQQSEVVGEMIEAERKRRAK